MDRKVMIQLSGVKKQYQIGQFGAGTLQGDLSSWWARIRGKEDPNSIIGSSLHLNGKKFMALNGIDLTIYQGEAVGIIGSNGAGKSTLLKLLSRITAPSEGEIDLYGQVTSMLEVGTGFSGEMTGRENVYLNGAILGMSRNEIDKRMNEIIDFSEVGKFIDTPVKRYSSGMFVKLAFSIAAHLNSDIMIMDEVLAVGDMAFQKKCLEKMKEAARQEKRTVLYVSHNMDTIRRLCDRVIVLNEGKVIYDGKTEQGIAIYMDHSLIENEVELDLINKPHGVHDPVIQMRHLTLVNKSMPVYEEGEKLILDLNLNILVKKEILFRITLRNSQDVAIGTSYSDPYPLSSTGKTTLRIEMPIASIAKGIFYASIGIYTLDELGNRIVLDHISRAFKIELSGNPAWNQEALGYMHLEKNIITIQNRLD